MADNCLESTDPALGELADRFIDAVRASGLRFYGELPEFRTQLLDILFQAAVLGERVAAGRQDERVTLLAAAVARLQSTVTDLQNTAPSGSFSDHIVSCFTVGAMRSVVAPLASSPIARIDVVGRDNNNNSGV